MMKDVTTVLITEFLNRFSVEELTSKGILRAGNHLTNRSVDPLISLMTAHDVTRLCSPEGDWFLTSQGEFQNPHSTEAKSGSIGSLNKYGNVFYLQNPKLNPFYIPGSTSEVTRSAPEIDADDPSDEAHFRLESDLQRALRANIQQLESGLTIIDGGSERRVDTGRIDITAEDSEGCLVVIELKAGRANLAAIGQLLSYMGSLSSEPDGPVRGILVASDFDSRLVAAAKAVPNVSLAAYSFQFSFRVV